MNFYVPPRLYRGLFCLLALSVCFAVRVIAVTVTAPAGHATITANSSSGGDLTWHITTTAGFTTNTRIQVASGGNGAVGDSTILVTLNNYSGGYDSGDDFGASYAGNWVIVTAADDGGAGSPAWLFLGAAVTYKVTFAIPANNTDRLIRYEVWQSGSFTGNSVTTSPGDPASEYTAQGLTSNATATLREVSPNLVQDATTGAWFFGDSNTVRVINAGTTPVTSSGSNNSAPANPGPTTPVTGQPNPPPAVSATPNGNKNVYVTNSTVASTPGATSDFSISAYREGVDKITSKIDADTAAIAAKITAADAAQATRDGVNGGKLDAIKSAVDTVKTAVDQTKTAVVSVKDAIDAQTTAATTRATTEATAITDATTAVNADSAAQQAGLAAKLTAAQGRAADGVTAFNATATSTAVTSLVGTASPMIPDNGYAGTAHTVNTSALGDVLNGSTDGAFDTNPLTGHALAGVIGDGTAVKFATWIKNFISWCVVVAFLTWTYGQVRDNCFAMSSSSQMSLSASSELLSKVTVFGNAVGVPAATALWAFQIVAVSTLLISAPVVLVAGFGDAAGTVAITAIAKTAAGDAVNSPGAFLSNSASFIYVIMPVALLITAFLNALLVRVSAITQWIITVVMLKVFAV